MSRDSGNFEGVFRRIQNKARQPKKKKPKQADDIFAAGTGKGGTYGVRIHKAKSGAVKGRGKLGGVR